MTQRPKSGSTQAESQQEKAVKDTFPASDAVPPSGGRAEPRPPASPRKEDDIEKDLDEALDESFPASDPPNLTDPDHDKG